MDYAEALSKLSDLEGGQEIVSAIKAEVSKKGEGEASVRKRLKAYEGIDPDRTRKVFDTLREYNLDLEGDIDEQLSAISEKAGRSDSASSEVQKLQRQVEKLQKEYETEKQERARIAEEKRKGDIFQKLHSSFKDRVLNPDVTLDYRISRGDFVLTDDGQVAFKNGEDLVTDDLIDNYLKVNPTEARNTQSSGGGSDPNSGRNGKINLKGLSAKEIAAMPRDDVYKALQGA